MIRERIKQCELDVCVGVRVILGDEDRGLCRIMSEVLEEHETETS